MSQVPNINEPLIEMAKPGKITNRWWRFFHDLSQPQAVGFTGSIQTAKLTPGGSTGTMFFTNGVLTGQSPAT